MGLTQSVALVLDQGECMFINQLIDRMSRVLIVAVITFVSVSVCSALPVFSVTADENFITLKFSSRVKQDMQIFGLNIFDKLSQESDLIFEGKLKQNQIKIKRIQNNRDHLYSQFIIKNTQGKIIAGPIWVNEYKTLPDVKHSMPWPKEIKGVSNPENLEDLKALGVKHVHINITLSSLLLDDSASDPPKEFTKVLNGVSLRFNPTVVNRWDRQIKGMTDAGINVVVVFLNALPSNQGRQGKKHFLINPSTDISGTPMGLAAFNLSTKKAVANYVGALGFLAKRYSRRDKKFGWIGGYIIGNEVDMHWMWHNMGHAKVEKVAAHYIKEIRLAWLAIKQHRDKPNVFASFTHSWAKPNRQSPTKNTSSKKLLLKLITLSRRGGDFDWGVAYHPYPENLFEPRFWLDKQPTYSFDTPKITFKNIEVLVSYLKQDKIRVNGKMRKLILSEQGFHTPKSKEGEATQAAAYALAYHRVKQLPEIKAFILHRHVDAIGEGGLMLGIRGVRQPGQKLGKKKKTWHIFKAAGTNQFYSEAGFALDVAGYQSWEDADIKSGSYQK